MDSEIIDTVADWSSEPYSGGYGGLHDLAEREFTGAVTDGAAWLFALNGRTIGVAGGTIESFADADGTAYAAPDPSLPLLLAMRERGGETKAKYYTNDTSLAEADRTLSAGNFTGFVELSENVLSGDYYVVYHGGRRLACAFVGTQRTVLTGDEAFERADDEVGIYEVRTVDVEVIDIPGPEPASTDSVETDADDADGTTASNVAVAIDEAEGDTYGDSDEANGGSDEANGGGNEANEANDEAKETPSDADAGSDETPTADDIAADSPADADDGATEEDDGDAEEPSSSPPSSPSPSAEASNEGTVSTKTAGKDTTAESRGEDAAAGDVGANGDSSAAADSEKGVPPRREESRARKRQRDAEPTDAVAASESDPFSAEEQWRETRDIPSLDPDETASRGTNGSARARPADASGDASAANRQNWNGEENGASNGTAESSADASSASAADSTGAASGGDGAESAETAESAELRQELQRAQSAREDAANELDATREELTETRSEAERLREENGRLEERVETLQTDLADARSRLSEMSDAPADSSPISPSQALAGTNLFVRYDSKGAGTLEKAHAGGLDSEEVNENLRLEVHTEFAADGAVVDGRPYAEWLANTIEYGFVEWAVRTLLYEIQDTNNESVMRDVFDAVPKIDRAELDAVVDLVDEAGKKTEERRFDVVLRDRMGEPLIVANVTDSREATTESMLDGLVEGASSVADQFDELASAFHVTGSFFEPGALEAVADATGGGLLNRAKRKSFVKMSRKGGFHLCLVESREGEFHVNVPEL